MYKLLIVSPFFPPVESVATNRIVSFCKYLKFFDITVITKTDGEFIEEYVDGVKVIRVPDKSFFKKATFNKRTNFIVHNLKALYNRVLLFFQTDEYDGWRRSVLEYLGKNMLDVDVVLTSFAPISSHIIGLYLKNNCENVIWVADMRDQMSSNIFFPERYRRKIKRYEDEILKKADIITAVSKPIIDEFASKSGKNGQRFIEVRNGFDFEMEKKTEHKNNVWTISYTGTFYGARNPDNFLKALESLLRDGLIEELLINFVGVTKPIQVGGILSGKVKFFDKVTNKESLNFMRSSDALLLIHPTTELKGIYTGKLFEYIGMLKPIIALVDPQDVAAELINEGNFGFVADNEDLDGIKEVILKAYRVWKKEESFYPNIEIAKQCHRRFQVEKLEKSLLEMLEER